MDAQACIGCLLGTAVGDSLGLPYQGLSARRAARIFPGAARHHLLPGRGMVSDDTEHACFTARALLLAGDDVDAFGRLLASSLRWVRRVARRHRVRDAARQLRVFPNAAPRNL